jgi:hypothetical protein
MNMTDEHAEDAALLGVAELVHEVTDFPEARCRRIAAGIIALGDREYGEDE